MKIALIGYGKMGKAIEAFALTQNHEIVKKFDLDTPLVAPEQLFGVDVAIEFTQPSTAVGHISVCFLANVPVVVGTTGWYGELAAVRAACVAQNQALFTATNFSVGVYIFWQINKALAKIMDTQPQYEPQITEVHHTQKLDAPSGTAITTAEYMLPELSRKSRWVLGEGKNDALGIVAIRKNDVPGTHTVAYQSAVDGLELTHTAHNRSGFAQGAVLAAQWLVGKKGVFTMSDMLPMG